MQGKSELYGEIKAEIYRSLVLLGADNGLLGTVASWGEELPDHDVLLNLRGWNKETLKESKGRIEHYGMTFPHPVCSQDEAHKSAQEVS